MILSSPFVKFYFFEKSVMNTIRVPNSLDQDQDHSVCPDLGPYWLQLLSVDNKNHHLQGKSLTITRNSFSVINVKIT